MPWRERRIQLFPHHTHSTCCTACHSSVFSLCFQRVQEINPQMLSAKRPTTCQQHTCKITIKKREARGCIFPNVKSSRNRICQSPREITDTISAASGSREPTPGGDVHGCFLPRCSPGTALPWSSAAARTHLRQKDAALRATHTLAGKPTCLQQSISRGAGGMKTHWGIRGCCSSSTYRLIANQMGKTKDRQRTNLGKTTHSAPLHSEPVGHGAASQAELLLQKQRRSLKKQLGSLEERREP